MSDKVVLNSFGETAVTTIRDPLRTSTLVTT